MLLTLLIERRVFAAISISGGSLDLLGGMYLVLVLSAFAQRRAHDDRVLDWSIFRNIPATLLLEPHIRA